MLETQDHDDQALSQRTDWRLLPLKPENVGSVDTPQASQLLALLAFGTGQGPGASLRLRGISQNPSP
jgi:hypothetical protein